MSDTLRLAEMRMQRDPDAGFGTISVAVPSDIGEKDFAVLHKPIIESIRDITGCPCLSGRVRVVLETQFNKLVQVDLRTGNLIGR